MKFEAAQSDLKNAVNILNSVVARGADTVPILTHILIETDGDRVTLYGTNLNQSLNINVPAEVTEGGSICVPFERFSIFVRNVQEGAPVKFAATTENMRATISSNKSRTMLPCLPAEDTTRLTRPEDPSIVIVDGGDLKEIIGATVHFTHTSADRGALNCIRLIGKDGRLEAAAVDGHRLAIVDIPQVGELVEFEECLLSRDAAIALSKLIPTAGEVDILVGKRAIEITFDEVTYLARLSDGKFPNINVLLQHEEMAGITVECAALKASVLRASVALIGGDKKKGLPVRLSQSAEELHLSCSEGGFEAEDQIPAGFSGDIPEGWKLNYLYLLAILDAIKSKTVDIKITGKETPTLFHPTNDQKATFLISPMRG